MLRQQFGERWREVRGRNKKKIHSKEMTILLAGGPHHGRTMKVKTGRKDLVFNNPTVGLRYRRVCKNDYGIWVFEYVEPDTE